MPKTAHSQPAGNGSYSIGQPVTSLQNPMDGNSSNLPAICIPKHQLAQGWHSLLVYFALILLCECFLLMVNFHVLQGYP